MGCYKAETRWIITRLAGYAASALHQVSSIDVSEALMFNYLLLTILHLSADPSVLLCLSSVLEAWKVPFILSLQSRALWRYFIAEVSEILALKRREFISVMCFSLGTWQKLLSVLCHCWSGNNPLCQDVIWEGENGGIVDLCWPWSLPIFLTLSYSNRLERDALPLFRMLRQKYKPSLDRDPSLDEVNWSSWQWVS